MCRNPSSTKSVNAVAEQSISDDGAQHIDLLKIYSCQTVGEVEATDDEKAWYTDLPVGQTSCKFKIDTAAEYDTLSEESYKKLPDPPPLLLPQSLVKPYGVSPFRPLGRIAVKYQSHDLEFVVMPGNDENLLGFKTCKKLGLIQRDVGKIPGKNKIFIDEKAQPTTARVRRFAYSLVPKIVATLKDMLAQDIIAPVKEPTSWVSNITVVEKVIDLKSGFWHMELDEPSSKLTTFNSPIGRFRFKRLCFGINCAPEMFMAEMYKQATMQFLGLVVSPTGIQPAPKHVRVMVKMPTPADKQAILRFLGLIKFLARFMPNVAQLTANLRALTKKDAEFQWNPALEAEFQQLKQLVASQPVLVYFDSAKPIVVQTDSSKDGLGSVLLQEEKPVAFASRALTQAEVRYSQIEKELLAIVFAMEKFHEYVYGLPVTVQSDHRPLESILQKDLNKVSPRLQRLRLRLLKYNVKVVYTPGGQMLVADALSRAYLTDEKPNLAYQTVIVHAVKSVAITPQKVEQLAASTKSDAVLQKVLQWVETDDWPANVAKLSKQESQYVSLRPSLSICDGLLFYENRLIVPTDERAMIVAKLHEGHLGAEKTKRLGRETVFWPGMTTEIDIFVNACQTCQKFARNNTSQPLQPYPISSYPWQQLAVDIATLNSRDFLIVIDKFSNWPEVIPIASKAAKEIVSRLQQLFACHGIPEVIISDNNPFNSAEYLQFASDWGFQARFTSPHHAQANGHAERTVQTVKTLLRKSLEDGTSFQYALLQYRNTPIADTGFSPAQVLFGRRLRTKVPVASNLLLIGKTKKKAKLFKSFILIELRLNFQNFPKMRRFG